MEASATPLIPAPRLLDAAAIRDSALGVIHAETRAIQALRARIDSDFIAACQLMWQCPGRVVVTGLGKSGHIGRKVAATLASTGTPSFFVHSGEASHGDLGMITGDDLVLALSNSGKTEEVLAILPTIKRQGTPLLAMTGDPDSKLAREADVHLDVSVDCEACPLGLAPTSSTTVTLVMGDALAVALLEARGFSAEDFAFSHPGGSLGRRLLLKVADVMHTGERLPKVTEDAMMREALLEISRKGLGMAAIVDAEDRIIGVFTDGDLRRTLDRNLDVHTTPIGSVMTRNCRTIGPEHLAAEALNVMEEIKINGLLVSDDDNRLVGALNMHDLLRAGVI